VRKGRRLRQKESLASCKCARVETSRAPPKGLLLPLSFLARKKSNSFSHSTPSSLLLRPVVVAKHFLFSSPISSYRTSEDWQVRFWTYVLVHTGLTIETPDASGKARHPGRVDHRRTRLSCPRTRRQFTFFAREEDPTSPLLLHPALPLPLSCVRMSLSSSEGRGPRSRLPVASSTVGRCLPRARRGLGENDVVYSGFPEWDARAVKTRSR